MGVRHSDGSARRELRHDRQKLFKLPPARTAHRRRHRRRARLSTEARRYPSMAAICDGFGTEIDVLPVPIPLDCRDGFNEAYYGRPEMLLEDGARLSCSAWSFVTREVVAGYIDRLRTEIEDGRWDEK
jgi:hypothetical protein